MMRSFHVYSSSSFHVFGHVLYLARRKHIERT